MICPNVSAPIFEGTSKRDPLDQRVFEYLQFAHWGNPDYFLHDEASPEGSIYRRLEINGTGVGHTLFMTQSFSDFYAEVVEMVMALNDGADGPVDRPVSEGHVLFLTDSFTKTGGCCATSPPVPATFDSNAFAGMVVYIVSDGVVDLAQADALPQADAVGVASIDVVSGSVGYYLTEGRVTRADWTAVAGTAALTPAAMYYLSEITPGMITITPPSGISEHSVRIGRAITSSTLDVEIAQEVIL